jgi:hypothetical protein
MNEKKCYLISIDCTRAGAESNRVFEFEIVRDVAELKRELRLISMVLNLTAKTSS